MMRHRAIFFHAGPDAGRGGAHTVPEALRTILRALPNAAVAFSGGVDSGYLLYAAAACGAAVRAYYVNSPFQPRFELEDARMLAGELGACMTVIPLDVLEHDRIASNPPDRCYHCKRAIFEAVTAAAARDGCAVLLDGSNADDDERDRPGMRALRELGVRSPLREAGLTKARIRELAREAGLFLWDKPAYACLATRVPSGVPLTAEMLERIEHAEDALARMGFTDFRARVMGSAARLQLPADQLADAARRHGELLERLKPWFEDVLLDLKPR